jgi:hypothetical protein
MKKIICLLSLVFLLISFGTAFGAGAGRITMESDGSIDQYIWAYTADASGDASAAELPYAVITGTVFAFTHIPDDAADSTDLVISATKTIKIEGTGTRTDTVTDILNGQGADLLTADSGKVESLLSPYSLVKWQVQPTFSNAGNAGSGTLVLWVWRVR